ncbi:MAG TPA: hypothetical protein VK628_00410, partial [Flavitalea sp.]|nr:hypothetical protein [Flavitalea sp.]
MRIYLSVLLVISIGFSSCQKILDFYHNQHHQDEELDCKVTSLAWTNLGFHDLTTISYDDAGFPVNINYLSKDAEDQPILEFDFKYNYDSWYRLVSETSVYVYGPKVVYHLYKGTDKLPYKDSIPGLFG